MTRGRLESLLAQHVTTDQSALGTDGERLYLLGNESHELLDIDVDSGDSELLWGQAPTIESNLGVSDGAFICASGGQIPEIRIRYTPG